MSNLLKYVGYEPTDAEVNFFSDANIDVLVSLVEKRLCKKVVISRENVRGLLEQNFNNYAPSLGDPKSRYYQAQDCIDPYEKAFLTTVNMIVDYILSNDAITAANNNYNIWRDHDYTYIAPYQKAKILKKRPQTMLFNMQY